MPEKGNAAYIPGKVRRDGMDEMQKDKLLRLAEEFAAEGRPVWVESYGNGHINDTYLLIREAEEGKRRYILQRINHKIFKEPDKLMENIVGVTGYLREKLCAVGGDPERETINVIKTVRGENFFRDEQGGFWRMYAFIEGAVSMEAADEASFYESAVAFGHFQSLLADYPAHTLHVTIEKFHNTPDRYRKLRRAVEADVCGRAKEVREEIEFALAREKEAGIPQRMLERGELPLRVTHNDTKLNNVMMDEVTGKGVCVIDLDTVMPGLAIFDFGDSIRFGASTAAEDEKDLTLVSCSMDLYEAYVKGFLEGCGHSLTRAEKEMLPEGARIMTLECGVRFLTDYLQGDVYFKTHRAGHNLDRCRTQFKLVADMEQKREIMEEITGKYR